MRSETRGRASRGFRAVFGGAVAVVVAVVAPSCGGHTQSPGTDSNTHWLDQCASDSDCGGLKCRCGACTASCQSAADCRHFSADAVCATTCNGEPPSCVRGGDSGTAPPPECPETIVPGTHCDSPNLVCHTRCTQGFYGNYTCGEGDVWVAGHGLFPCGPDGGGGAGGNGGGGNGGSPSHDAGGLHPDSGPPDCTPQDAHNGVAACLSVAGYAWDGSNCNPLLCGCTGSDCGDIYETAQACQSAHAACLEQRGAAFSCETSADCSLVTTTCCGPCHELSTTNVLAVNLDSIGTWNAHACAEPVACPPVCVNTFAGLTATCREHRCETVDLWQYQHCTTNEDCHLVAKDCCACGALQSAALAVISDDVAFVRDRGCTAKCVECPGGISSIAGDQAVCNTQTGQCEHVYGD